MKSKFNLFGFEFQVNRPVRYGIAFDYEGMNEPDDEPVWESKSAFYTAAVLRGWMKARLLAKLYQVPVTYVIFRFDIGLIRLTQVRSGTIRIKKSVAFFAR